MASTNVLDTILWNLRHSDQTIREKALQSFEDYVRSSLASGKSDDGESFWDEVINKVLFPLTSTSDTPQEKLVGIAAIDKLLRSPSDDPHPTTAPASATSNPSAASTSSTNPSAKRFLYRLLRFVKNLLPDANLQVMTAAANTYGTILRTGGQVFAETLVETEVQEAVRYMEEQAAPPQVPNADGTGGYAEWTGAANRARMIANQSSKLLADATANQTAMLAPPLLAFPAAQQQQLQLLSPTTPKAQAPPREKEKILAPHARIAGVLILIQIATVNPHMYHQYTKLVLSRILCPLRDGCRFWVVKGSEEDLSTSLDSLEGDAEDLLASRHMAASVGSISTPNGSAPTSNAQSGPGGKGNIEARDVVRRLAARLFRVTLRVIASREAGLGHGIEQEPVEEENVDEPTSGPTLTRRGSKITSTSVSSSSLFPQTQVSQSQIAGGGGGQTRARKGVRTSKPLVDVATAAANDLAAYLRVTMTSTDAKGKGKSRGVVVLSSAPAQTSGTPLPAGNIHRAFGALLIYRELLESGLASLAGLYVGEDDELLSSLMSKMEIMHEDAHSNASRLMRGGIRYTEDGSVVDGSTHPRAGPPAHSNAGLIANSGITKRKMNPLVLPVEALAQPPPYTSTFSAVFYLATRSSSAANSAGSGASGGGSSLLSVGARMLGAPVSPGGWGSPPSSVDGFPAPNGGTSMTGAGIPAALGGVGYSGPGWSLPLSPLSRHEQEEQIRREALGLLPVCAAYDTARFESGGWFTATMSALIEAWGIDKLGEATTYSSSGEPVSAERGDRSYLVKLLGELARAMHSSNAMLNYTWVIGIILHGSLESRAPPPEPWRYNNYYSPAAMAARVSPTPVATMPAQTHTKQGSKSRVPSGARTSHDAGDTGKLRVKSTGLGGKEGKAISMPKGCISDEVLFEAMALIAMSTGNALAVMHTAGRPVDGDGYLEGEVTDEQLAYRRVVEKMFRFGINPALCVRLGRIVQELPQLLGLVQEHLLNEISTILAGHGFRPPGSPYVEANVPNQGSALTMKPPASKLSNNPALIRLALTMLQTFDWQARSLTPLIQDGVLAYMDSKDREVRLQASLATCALFMHGPIVNHTSTASVGIIDEVVGRLIRVGLSDPDAEIRALVLRNLDARYDRRLAQVEHVRVLSMALNDEEPQVRREAVRIVGRLAVVNPANVMPSLRMELIKLLTDLEYSTDASSMLTTAEVLTELLKRTERLLKPYVPSLLKVCLPKAKVMYPYVSRRMVQCIGLLATISGDDVAPFFDEIMELFLTILQNPTAVLIKKEITLVSMGQLCANTSNVIDPYLKHPDLFRILKGFLKEEYGDKTKRKVLQVIGILGAIDPFTRRKATSVEVQEKTPAAKALQQSVKTVGSQPEVFYQSVVIQALLSILADASLATNHPDVIDVILAIFKTQGLKCVSFLPQVIPAFSAMCRASHSRHQDFYVQQMSLIVQIIGSHIRNYLDEVFQLTRDLWQNPILHLPIVELIESLANAMGAEFKPYLPAVIPQLLTVFNQPEGNERSLTEVRVFQAMLSFGSAVEEYIHLVLPFILATLERPTASRESRRVAVVTIGDLGRRINLAESTSRIIHPLVRTLPGADHLLRTAIMDTLCVLLLQLGPDFAVFIPRIQNCLSEHRIAAPRFETLADTLMKGEPLPQGLGSDEKWGKGGHADPVASADVNKLIVNQQRLKSAWSVEQEFRPEDWQLWLKQLTLELMKQSTSHALRACVSLANSHEPLARELFNAAFYSCWVELTDPHKDQLVIAITHALTESKSADLRMRLLSLVEFMEHEDKSLPIDNRTLGDIAANTFAMAKALHFKEHEYLVNPSVSVVEQLIGINASLKQQDAALGLLNNDLIGPRVDPVLWYEQLDRWEDASVEYADRISRWPDDQGAIIGRLKCLHALNEWDALGQGVEQRWPSASPELRATLAPFAAASAWVLRKWDEMDQYVAAMTSATTERSFFKAIVSAHNNHFDTAAMYIGKARDALVMELGPIDDYNRVYSTVVRTQLLSELEEVITYKKSADQPDRQQIIKKTWVKRLRGCQHDVDTWQRILQLRSLVISPSEDAASYIKFANLCRKAKRLNIAESIIQQLLNDQAQRDSPIRASPGVVFAHLKLLWDTGDKEDSLNYLGNVCTSLAREIGLDDPGRVITGNLEEIEEVRRLLSRAFLKQGEWIQELRPEWTTELVEDVMQCYHNATQLDPKWYKAWHTWALCNFEVINHIENTEEDREDEMYSKALSTHILAAIVGFFRSVALGGENPIQDSLRLLTLWFKFGADEEVTAVVAENVNTVSIDTWLEVVPQLIARIQTPSHIIRQQINALLTQVGRVHPQALIYPLTVASKSNSQLRHMAAEEIMDRLREHSALLVEQALTVSHELIRVAILWHELWHEYLEEASRLYFTEKKPEAMIEHLEILHRRLDQGPETTREASFVQVHGKDLREAREACHRYLLRHEASDMDKAWDIYYAVFRRIEKQLPLLTTIDLQYVSPKLLQSENLELAVPGTYRSGKPVIKIARFVPKLSVIASKQRPRRLAIVGSDTKEYQFLLKGHEDLRQDERVMQVFSLVNTLLEADRQSFMRKLHIQGFAVIPLAPNVGLLRWVLHADTLHVLVSDYRQARKIHLQIEYRLMLQMAPDYVNLTMLQKLEVFKYALDNTTGQDLYRVLWLTSGDSEAWLERRSTYTRTLAVSSMVGHILGLGDRHPANLLLDQITGKVVHIDFGDCFEIAMHREKFPERIPFRLTRMLVSAMEVSGIEGSFKKTSEITMQVLRDNREPLMAVLEAFIYDPLVSWRLTTETETRATGKSTAAVAGGGATGDETGGMDPAAYNRYAGGPRRKQQLNERLALNEDTTATDWRNAKALEVYQRVQKKLVGRDFDPNEELSVEEQVRKLIRQATALENLCQCFPGWCPFW